MAPELQLESRETGLILIVLVPLSKWGIVTQIGLLLAWPVPIDDQLRLIYYQLHECDN